MATHEQASFEQKFKDISVHAVSANPFILILRVCTIVHLLTYTSRLHSTNRTFSTFHLFTVHLGITRGVQRSAKLKKEYCGVRLFWGGQRGSKGVHSSLRSTYGNPKCSYNTVQKQQFLHGWLNLLRAHAHRTDDLVNRGRVRHVTCRRIYSCIATQHHRRA